MLIRFWRYLPLLMGIYVFQAEAITIDISGGQEGALPIAVVPFGMNGPNALPVNMAQVIAADLRRSGRFAPLAERDLISQPHTAAEVHFEDWRLTGSANLVVGLVQPIPTGYAIQFELFDVFKAADQRLTGLSFNIGPNENLRRVAHKIANIVYQQLTGEVGAFDTRIAYVAAGPNQGRYNNSYTLQVADADGDSPASVLTSKEPILSPAWSPDGTKLAYVSFEGRHSAVYVQDLMTGRRDTVASYPGTNSAPAWSPDGHSLAVSLSKDGNPEIYVIDLDSHSARRLTTTNNINTEPTWSPDGSSILFTSDRGGSPQIYRVSVSGGSPERITFEGSYNARAAFSPDGRRIALVHGNGSQNHIAILDLNGGGLREITHTGLDQSPSFAPNGTLVLYSTESGGHGVLRVVSIDGRTPQALATHESNDVRASAWGPFNKQQGE